MLNWSLGLVGLVALAAGCGEPSGGQERHGSEAVLVRDDAGRMVRLGEPAQRVVSLVPSVTESIAAMGSTERLVARTRYDSDPGLAALPSVGGGLDPSLEAIAALAPDLVIGWDAAGGSGIQAGIERLGIPFYSASIEDTAGVFRTLDRLGTLLGEGAAAERVTRTLRDTLAAVARRTGRGARPVVLWVLGGDPPRIAAGETFIAELVRIAGGRLAFPELAGWPEVSTEAIVARPPDVIVVADREGSAAATGRMARRPGLGALKAVREGRVIAVPPELFERPGPGMGEAARTLARALAETAPGRAAKRAGDAP